MSTLSVFRKINDYKAKVLVKATPEWNSPTMLLRCVEEDGKEMTLTMSNKAYESCIDIQEQRVYLCSTSMDCQRKKSHSQGRAGQYQCNCDLSRLFAQSVLSSCRFRVNSEPKACPAVQFSSSRMVPTACAAVCVPALSVYFSFESKHAYPYR